MKSLLLVYPIVALLALSNNINTSEPKTLSAESLINSFNQNKDEQKKEHLEIRKNKKEFEKIAKKINRRIEKAHEESEELNNDLEEIKNLEKKISEEQKEFEKNYKELERDLKEFAEKPRHRKELEKRQLNLWCCTLM